MRVGLVVSTVGHVAVLFWGLVALPSTDPFTVPPVDALPVDLVPISEITDLYKGTKTAELRDQPSEARKETPPTPEASPKPVGQQDAPSPEPPAKEPEQAASEPAAVAPPPPEAPEPEVAPEAPPEPPAPEAPSEPQPAETPEAAPQPAEAAEATAEPLPPTAIPRTKPTPPKPTKVARAEPDKANRQRDTQATNKKNDFNPDKISALLNKTTPTGGGTQTASRPASLGTRTGNDNARMTQSELDALRAQISRCWNPPIGAQSAEGLKVRLKVFLNRDGSVANPPKILNSGSDPFFRAAADSARRAVLRCQPYQLPADKFDAWNEVNVTFDPRELFGG